MFSVETLAGDTRNFTPEELSVYEFGVHEEEIVEDKPSISSSSIALNREKRSVTEKPVATAAVMAATSSLGPRTRAMLSSEAADDNENMASLSSAESSNDSSVESKAASKGNTKSKQDVGKLKPKETEIKPAATRKGATRSIVVTSNPSNEDMEAAAQPDARRPMKSTPRTLSVPTKEKEKVRTAIDEELVKNSRRDDLAEKEKIIAKEVKRVAAKEGNAEENNEKVAREREEGKKNPPPPINSSSINISNMSSSASSLIQTKTSSAAASSSSVSAPPRVAEWQTTTLPTTTAPGWGYVEESHPNSVKYRFYGNDSDIVEVTAHQIYGKSNCIKDLLAIGDIEWTCAVQSDAELAKLGSFEGLLQSSDVIENVSMYRMDPDFRPDMTKLISKCPKDATLLAFPEHCPFEVLLLFRKKLSFIHFIRSRGLIDVISQTSDLSKESHYVVTILKGFFHPLQNIHYASSFSEEGATVVSTPSSSSSPPIRSATLNASKSPPVHVTQEEQQRASTIIKVAKMPTSSLNAIPREKSPIDVVPQKGDVNSFFDSVLLDATKGVPREKKNEGWADVLCLPTWENGNIISAPSTNKATEISVSGSSGLKREASLKVLNGSGTASNGGTTAPVMIRLPTNPATSDYPRAPLIPSRTVKRLREDDALSEPRCKSESPRPKSQNRRPKDQVACRNGRRCTINPCPYNHMAECRNGSICTILHCRFGH